MNPRVLLFAASLALLVACGGTDNKTFTLTSGTYAVSGATTSSARPSDQCGLIGAYTDPAKRIDITVNGTTATFNLSQNTASNTWPTATINANALDELAAASYTANSGTCLLRLNVSVTGELTANDDTALTLNFDISQDTASPGTCTAADVSGSATVFPCQSGYHFLAKKVATP